MQILQKNVDSNWSRNLSYYGLTT